MISTIRVFLKETNNTVNPITIKKVTRWQTKDSLFIAEYDKGAFCVPLENICFIEIKNNEVKNEI